MKPEETTELRFGSYEVLTKPDGTLWELGAGGFGRTFRARHRLLGTEVALKVIHDRHAFDSRAKARFIREAQEQANLVHPGIARITYCDEVDGTLFYVMDLCEGGDLQRYVEQAGQLSVAEAFFLIEQAADAIAFAHGRGLIHRDIKPSNLLLVFSDDGWPVVKLIDFGLVKRVDGKAEATAAMLTQDGQSLFSPAFASPEQMREQKLDARSDIFSLGMTLWFLLAGGRPVEGSTAEVVSDRLSAQEYDRRLPPGVTGPPRAVLAKMLRKSPGERYQSGRELLEDIRACRKSLPLAATMDWRDRQRRQVSVQERYEVQPAGDSALGSLFRGHDRRADTAVELTVVSKELAAPQLQQLLQAARRLMEARHPGLVQVLDVAQYEEGWAIVREFPEGESLLNLLRQHGAPGLQRGLALLQELAMSFDAAEQLRVPSVAAHPSEIVLQPRAGSSERGAFDWQVWRPKLQPQFVATGGRNSDPGATAVETLVARDGDFRPAFAGLLFWVVAGKSAPHSARLDVSGYTPVPGLGEESNRILAGVMAGEEEVESCEALLRMLQHLEGISEKKIEAERRRALGEMFDSLAGEARAELDALDGTLAEIEAVAATVADGQAFAQEAAGFRQQAKDALLSLSRDSLPETASSTILYATLNEAEGALTIMREALAGARLLHDRARAVAAEEALSREQWNEAQRQTEPALEAARVEAAGLMRESAGAADACAEAAELLPSAEEWAARLQEQADRFGRLGAKPLRTVADFDRAREEADGIRSQAEQALEQLRTWSRQILKLAERARRQEQEERQARDRATAQFGTILDQVDQWAAGVDADAAGAQAVADALPETAPLAARAAEAATRCREIAGTLRELAAGVDRLPLPEVQQALARAMDLQAQVRDQQSIASQTAVECESIRATAEAAARREREHILTESKRLATRLRQMAATASAQVKELDRIALRYEEAGPAFLAASRAGRTTSKASAEADALLEQAESGAADSALLANLETLVASAESSAREISGRMEEAQAILTDKEEQARAAEVRRDAALREIGQVAADAAEAWEDARAAVAALGPGESLPPETAGDHRELNDRLRDARRLVREAEEFAAAAESDPPANLDGHRQSAAQALDGIRQVAREIRQDAARLLGRVEEVVARDARERDRAAREAAGREAAEREAARQADEARREVERQEAERRDREAREAAARAKEERDRLAAEKAAEKAAKAAEAAEARARQKEADRQAREEREKARQSTRRREPKRIPLPPPPTEPAPPPAARVVSPPPAATAPAVAATDAGGRKFPVLPVAAAAALAIAGGVYWIRRDKGGSDDPVVDDTGAKGAVSEVALRGAPLPAGADVFRLEGEGTAARDPADAAKLVVRTTAAAGSPVRLLAPGGYSFSGKPSADLKAGEPASLELVRETGEVKPSVEDESVYTRAFLTWQGPLSDQPAASPPENPEIELKFDAPAGASLPTGVYAYSVDDDIDGAQRTAGGRVVYERRQAGTVEVKAGASLPLQPPAVLPDRLTGELILTIDPPESFRKVAADAGGTLPVISTTAWRRVAGVRLNVRLRQPELTLDPDISSDSAFAALLIAAGEAIGDLRRELPKEQVDALFANIPAMDAWNSADTAAGALRDFAAAFEDASLPGGGGSGIAADSRAAVRDAWRLVESAPVAMAFSLRQVGADGTAELTRVDETVSWQVNLTPAANGTWQISGTRTTIGDGRQVARIEGTATDTRR